MIPALIVDELFGSTIVLYEARYRYEVARLYAFWTMDTVSPPDITVSHDVTFVFTRSLDRLNRVSVSGSEKSKAWTHCECSRIC